MEHRRPGRVFRLQFIPPAQQDFLSTPRQQLEDVIVAGRRTSRYGRTWIVGQTQLDGDVLSGRIGFMRAGTTEWWDDAKQDFIDIEIPAGTTAPFAINLFTMEAVMQAGTAQIKILGLIGAFKDLLADAGHKWKIVGASQETSLAEWKASVLKVTAVKFTIKKPNPHYGSRENLKAIMEEMESEVIRLEAINEENGVNLDSPFLVETEEHVEAGYGDAVYHGVKGAGSEARESVYTTTIGAEENIEEVAVNPRTGEVPTGKLRSMISDEPEEWQHERLDYLTDPFSDD